MKDFLISRKVLAIVSLICLALLIRGLYWLFNDWSPEAQIARYRVIDLLGDQPSAKGLALGSSTIRWMPEAYCGPWHNRGIGNATTSEIADYIKGSPAQHWEKILLYTGENDFAFGRSQKTVRQDVMDLLKKVDELYSPEAVYVLAIKHTPARLAFADEYAQFNSWLSEYSRALPNVVFSEHQLSTHAATLDQEAYQSDRLHLSSTGYKMFLAPLKSACADD
ncbi:GDSL-type esterase/lipase family protein [Allohahella sp. A8]|uniref:GDSL-type esterase/lipase family protein n=1 Tax=Allohahella sp. A8 TaxID=3141461 RepID=UPI003A7FC3C6